MLLLGACGTAQGQLARKPSAYEQPAQAQPRPPDDRAGVAQLAVLANRADFDRLARVYDAGTALEMPHVLFVIDRGVTPARMHYVNTPRFALHERFVRGVFT
ncbi:MAG: pyruvate, phosphate dikinase, partial [Oxalobacteraceae bacterium]